MAKSLARRLASPFTKRVYGRIDARAAELRRDIDTVPGLIDSRTADLAAEIESLNRYLPTVINTIASQNAASRETMRQQRACQDLLRDCQVRLGDLETGIGQHSDSITKAFERIEFVRRELLLEQRYGEHPGQSLEESAAPAAEVRVVDDEKLRRMRDELRVNVGAGHIALDGYLNVDSRELPGIDVVADVRNLPFQPEELAEVYSAHLLEHFPIDELRRVILPHWVSLLGDGGKFVAVVPDVEAMVAERASGRMPFDDLVEVLYGGQEYAGDFHFSGFSTSSLIALLEEAGLEDVKVVEEGRRNGKCLEMEIVAVRRVSSPD